MAGPIPDPLEVSLDAVQKGLQNQGIAPVAEQQARPITVDALPPLPTEPASRRVDPNIASREQWQAEGGAWRHDTFGGVIIGPPVALAQGVGRAFLHGDNFAVNLGKELYRQVRSGEVDPQWDNNAKAQWIDQNRKLIPQNQVWRYWQTKNLEEAALMFQDQQDSLQAMRINAAQGFGMGLMTSMIAGLVDLDTPITLATGGLSAGAKAGLLGSRAGRIISGAGGGFAMGSALGAVDYGANPNAEADDIVTYGLFGGGLGLIGGALSRSAGRMHDLAREAAEEHGMNLSAGRRPEPATPDARDTWGLRTPEKHEEARLSETLPPPPAADGASPKPARPEPQVFRADELEESGGFAGSSVGSTQAGARRPSDGVDNPTLRKVINAAADWSKRNPEILDELYEKGVNTYNSITEAAGRGAVRFAEVARRIGLGTDWDKFMRSGSVVAQKFAYDVLESASGIARNAMSASGIKEGYRLEMQTAFKPYMDAMREWLPQERGVTTVQGIFETRQYRTAVDDFNREVITELMARLHGGARSTNASVRQAADAFDKLMAMDVDIAKGRPGEIGMSSYKDIEAKSGYVPQSWSGERMQRMIDDAIDSGGHKAGNRMYRAIVNAIDVHYRQEHPLLKPEDSRKYAAAVVDRALIDRKSIGRDMLGLLSGDEADLFRKRLRENGLDDHTIDRIEVGLRGSREEKTRPGHTQTRIEVDFRGSVGNIKLMDLLDTDLFTIANRRIARTSGMAALARKGITNINDYEKIVAAALAEQKARGVHTPDVSGPTKLHEAKNRFNEWIDEPRQLTKEDFEGIYSYFSGGMYGGAPQSPWIGRILKTTRLALMNQLGITQFAEFGAIAGGVGLKHFMRHTGQEFSDLLKGTKSPLRKELEHMAIWQPPEAMFKQDLMHEFGKMTESSAIMGKFDQILDTGMRIQGHLSGFFGVKNTQQRIAITSATSRIMESIKRGDGQFSDARLKDMGVDMDAMKKYVANGQVKFDSEGRLTELGLEKWERQDVEQYRVSMVRMTSQLVQEALAGESNVMFHKDGIAKLFWQFKSFPLLAVEKQFARNMRMADTAALQTFMFGLITAGMAHTIRAGINGRTENLTPEKIAYGALNYSNMTGWMPMWADPVAAMLGIEDFNLSGYTGRQGSEVFSIPASLTTLDRLVQAPQAAVKVAGSALGVTEYSNKDVRSLQTIPIFGQLYGMNFLLNQLKHKSTRTAEQAPDPSPPEPAVTPEAARNLLFNTQ